MAKDGQDNESQAETAKPAKTKDLLRRPARRPGKDDVEVAGLVADVFGRRFTLEADGARTLVDLGRRGAAMVTVSAGTRLVVTGRRKNGELKAWALRSEDEARARVVRKEKRMKKLGAGPQPAPAASEGEAAAPEADPA